MVVKSAPHTPKQGRRKMNTKLDSALRRARAGVFDENPARAEACEIAIKRIKKTRAFQSLCDENRDRATMRINDRLNRQGY
jgi:hypothetical protein